MTEGNLARVIEADPLGSSDGDADISMAALARECLVASGHSQNAAMDLMADRVMADPDLMDRFARALIRKACSEVIKGALAVVRSAVLPPPPGEANGRGAVIALAAGNRATLYDFPLPGGKPLGSATGEEVSRAAHFYGTQATDMSVKAKWLSLIAKKVKAGVVRDALSLDDLNALQVKARGAR